MAHWAWNKQINRKGGVHTGGPRNPPPPPDPQPPHIRGIRQVQATQVIYPAPQAIRTVFHERIDEHYRKRSRYVPAAIVLIPTGYAIRRRPPRPDTPPPPPEDRWPAERRRRFVPASPPRIPTGRITHVMFLTSLPGLPPAVERAAPRSRNVRAAAVRTTGWASHRRAPPWLAPAPPAPTTDDHPLLLMAL